MEDDKSEKQVSKYHKRGEDNFITIISLIILLLVKDVTNADPNN